MQYACNQLPLKSSNFISHLLWRDLQCCPTLCQNLWCQCSFAPTHCRTYFWRFGWSYAEHHAKQSKMLSAWWVELVSKTIKSNFFIPFGVLLFVNKTKQIRVLTVCKGCWNPFFFVPKHFKLYYWKPQDIGTFWCLFLQYRFFYSNQPKLVECLQHQSNTYCAN